ncbi:MAG: phosphoribosylaminoimidazolesuccinocarboxamide synthase [Firmicutes bacterium]|nr:phosphoribosylaminoimidazolesuccinocarboxamide synthase [Bacillota bacterium]
MKLLYKGKTKDVYALKDGNYLLQYKDDVTTGADGQFDPGANSTGLKIKGVSQAGVRLSQYFFDKIEKAGYPTHYVGADAQKAQMTVKPATIFGKGVEVICRLKATGSFVKRYGDYVKDGQPLDYFVEVTLKDDKREDPLITKDALAALKILTPDEYETLKDLTQKMSKIVGDELAKKGADLYDIKFEFGRCNGKITLIDEISGGNMRVYKNGKIMHPLDLGPLFF